ncbi:unnamed protein product, partial [Discosporangium mesarthrocarpum]
KQERDHFSQFVVEGFEGYVARKERDGVHGNNPEIQAVSELFNRPVEVYVPESGVVPINIFHGGYHTNSAPIRLSYHGRSHYNAVVDPSAATVGQGLGIPGLSKEAAEKELLQRAVEESRAVAWGQSQASLKASFLANDLRATEEELEQAVSP